MNNWKGLFIYYLASTVKFEEEAGVDVSMSILGSRHDLVGSVFIIIR